MNNRIAKDPIQSTAQLLAYFQNGYLWKSMTRIDSEHITGVPHRGFAWFSTLVGDEGTMDSVYAASYTYAELYAVDGYDRNLISLKAEQSYFRALASTRQRLSAPCNLDSVGYAVVNMIEYAVGHGQELATSIHIRGLTGVIEEARGLQHICPILKQATFSIYLSLSNHHHFVPRIPTSRFACQSFHVTPELRPLKRLFSLPVEYSLPLTYCVDSSFNHQQDVICHLIRDCREFIAVNSQWAHLATEGSTFAKLLHPVRKWLSNRFFDISFRAASVYHELSRVHATSYRPISYILLVAATLAMLCIHQFIYRYRAGRSSYANLPFDLLLAQTRKLVALQHAQLLEQERKTTLWILFVSSLQDQVDGGKQVKLREVKWSTYRFREYKCSYFRSWNSNNVQRLLEEYVYDRGILAEAFHNIFRRDDRPKAFWDNSKADAETLLWRNVDHDRLGLILLQHETFPTKATV